MTKPGIIYGNAITVIAGFLLASKGSVNFMLLFTTIIGISLVIASGCVVNNYLDRNIDKVMERTKDRALVRGTISVFDASVFAAVLGIFGILLLGIFTNNLVILIGVIAYIDYVVLYGIAKRRTVHSTFIGSISGAAPIVAGYCAVTGKLDSGAIILFLVLALWQMPHFYAIAMFRYKDYKTAKLPVLPVKKGMRETKIQIFVYIIAFIIATILLRIYGYTNNFYLIIMIIVGITWFWFGIKDLKKLKDGAWAKKMFVYSLIALLSFSFLISINSWTS